MAKRASLLFLLAITAPAVGQTTAPAGSLARSVPGDVRFFLEARDIPALMQSSQAAALGGLFEEVVSTQPAASAPAPATAPASAPATRPARRGEGAWRERLAAAMGLQNAAAVDMLFSGRIALVAESWENFNEAILISEPLDVPALEAQMKPALLPNPPHPNVRCYRLSGDHQLATDGQRVLLGRPTGPTGLFARTLGIWASDKGVSLAEVAEFQERTRELGAAPQVIVFAHARSRLDAQSALLQSLWPQSWPQIESVAIAAQTQPGGVVLDLRGRLKPGTHWSPSASDEMLLSRLPAQTLAAWTQSIAYAQEYARLSAAPADSGIGFYISVLRTGLSPEVIERDLLRHLHGNTLIVLSTIPPEAVKTPPGSRLILPAITMAVRVRAEAAPLAVLERAAGNLVALLNLRPAEGERVAIERMPLGPGGGEIRLIRVGQVFRGRTECEFLQELDICWTVADGLLVIGTHPSAVRDLVLARRGQAPQFEQPSRPPTATSPAPAVILRTQPALAATMFASWVRYLREFHPEVMSAEWWEALRRRQLGPEGQMGVVLTPTTGPAEVKYTLPDSPAEGRLQPGDRLLALGGVAVQGPEALASVRAVLATRPAPGLRVRVQRGAEVHEVDLVGPATQPATARRNPIELLRGAARVLRLFSRAHFSLWQPAPGLINARVTLQFASATRPAN